jgi:hypothetical protein
MRVAPAVAQGNLDIGIHQIAELMPIAGHRHRRTLPADLNKTVV